MCKYVCLHAKSGFSATQKKNLSKENAAKIHRRFPSDTVDGQNPAPLRMMIIPLFIGF